MLIFIINNKEENMNKKKLGIVTLSSAVILAIGIFQYTQQTTA